MKNRGVYFLANDRIIDLAIAFLNSFRSYNPTIPLCLIPFNAEVTRLAALQDYYEFSLFSNTDALRRCDEASLHFHNRVIGQYRKLAMWEGGFDEYIYIDSDTVVLDSIDFVYEFLSNYEFVTSHSNNPAIRKWVWKDSIYRTRALSEVQIAYATNTGFIGSKKNALTLEEITAKLPAAVDLSPHMELLCMEQPFLNYLMVTSGERYTSLQVIAMERGLTDMPVERWAGRRIGFVHAGRVIPPSEPRILLVHWAGEWQAARWQHGIVYLLEALGIQMKKPVIKYFMRNKRLWNYYRRIRHWRQCP